MADIIYREMTLSDLEQVFSIECKCFSQPWSMNSLHDEIVKNDVAYYYVAEADNRVIGYAGIWVMWDEAHMTNIAVVPEYRRRGIARNLMLNLMLRAVSLGAHRMTLEVRENNHKAQKVYASLGFRYVGIRRKYYSDTGENALILWNDSIEATLAENQSIKSNSITEEN